MPNPINKDLQLQTLLRMSCEFLPWVSSNNHELYHCIPCVANKIHRHNRQGIINEHTLDDGGRSAWWWGSLWTNAIMKRHQKKINIPLLDQQTGLLQQRHSQFPAAIPQSTGSSAGRQLWQPLLESLARILFHRWQPLSYMIAQLANQPDDSMCPVADEEWQPDNDNQVEVVSKVADKLE